MKLPPPGLAATEGGGSRFAFSLIEVLMAVTLMSALIYALLVMFMQAQRAAHLGTTQVDVMETGRATLQTVIEDLERISTSDPWGATNLIVTDFSVLEMPRGGNRQITNYLEEIFFISRQNDRWIGTGYSVEPLAGGVGTLLRFTNSIPISSDPKLLLANNPRNGGITGFAYAGTNDFRRLSDRIVCFQVTPNDYYGSNNVGSINFWYTNQYLPYSLELRLGVLDPKTYAKFRTLTNNPTQAKQFLENQVDHVNLFRRRIPIRSAL